MDEALMKTLLIFLFALGAHAQIVQQAIVNSTTAAGGGAACGTYTHYRVVTVPAQGSLSGDLSNYPMLFSGTYTYLATVANGGLVQNASGFDIAFYTDNTCTTKLNWETDTWTNTGVVNYWVNVPTISKTLSKTFVLAYDNAAITTDQSNKTATWPTTFQAVYHFPDGTTLTGNDSTANARTVTQLGSATATTGQIDGGASVGGLDIFLGSGLGAHGSAWTQEVWAYATAFSNSYNCTTCENETTANNVFALMVKSNGKLALYTQNSTGTSINYDGSGSHTLTTGNWYLLAFTYSSSAGLVGYVNGASDGTSAANGSLVGSSSAGVDLGLHPSIGGRIWSGKFDDTRIADTALSADWILTDYNSQSSPATFYSVGSQF